MSKTSTNLDIIKYIYNELEEHNKHKITIQSLLNHKTKDKIESLDEIKNHLDTFCLEPSERIINKIKAYFAKDKTSKYFV